MALTHAQIREQLQMRIQDRYPERYYWIRDVFADTCIVEDSSEQGLRYWRLSYAVSPEDIVSIGEDLTQVVQRTEYLPIVEAVRLMEAQSDSTGWTWEVVLLRPGLSLNGYYYDARIIQESIALFEGVRALSRSDADHTRGKGESVENVVGWYSDCRYVEGVGAVGTFHITRDTQWLRDKILSGWEKGKTDLVQFSLVASGNGRYQLRDGQLVTMVESLTHVSSVDIVLNASAGGRLLSLVAAGTEPAGEHLMLQELLKFIERHHPDLWAQIDQENVSEAQVLALMHALEEEHPSAAASVPAHDSDDTPSSPGGGEPAPSGAVATSTPPATTQAVAVAEARLKARLGEIQAADRRLQISMARIQLREALEMSRLPQVLRAHIAAPFEARLAQGQVVAMEEVEAEITRQNGVLGELHRSGHITGFGHEVASALHITEAEEDKTRQMWVDFFAQKPGAPASFKECYVQLTGDRRVSGRLSDCEYLPRFQRFSEAVTTTTFDQALQDAINNRLLTEYGNIATGTTGGRTPLNSWEAWVDIVPLTDFRTQHRVRYGGYGNLPIVGQGAAYTPLTSPTDEEATYAPAKRGGTEQITREAILNDDVQLILRIPRELALAAVWTLHDFIWGFLTSNAAIYDSVALFHANHNNLTTTAFGTDDTQYMVVRQLMRAQTRMDNSKPIVPMPSHLAVPNELESAARNAFIRDTNIDPRLSQVQAPMIHVVDSFTDANDWFVIADRMFTPTLELGFINNQREPEMFRQDLPNVGSLFTNDAITLKVRHEYGGAVKDFRAFQGAIVA